MKEANLQADRHQLFERLRQVPVFQTLKETDMACFASGVVIEAQAEEMVIEHGTPDRFFWIVLEGELRVVDGQDTVGVLKANETGGEVPLLAGTPSKVDVIANTAVRAVRLNEDSFWMMMTSCKEVRHAILRNMARRMEGLLAMTVQREKLATLGAMAAGLMHELNNPGAAAGRAASLLRANLMRLQTVGLQLGRIATTESQVNCLTQLQQLALAEQKPAARSSIEESDAEEAMVAWLTSEGITEAWKIAPTLVAIGIDRSRLVCARAEFSGESLAYAFTWLESLASSLQLIGTVEESISRVTELALAVKKYAYEGKSTRQSVDINESIASTLIILAHKLRHKAIKVEKTFAPALPPIQCSGAGLNQIWTNLLDNAIDAVQENGCIEIHTERNPDEIVITIADNGAGISQEHQPHIFEPFYTTKPQGLGTGMGLDIVHRIVHDKLHGRVTFSSRPGRTEFTVRLPLPAQN